ncbi:MAG: 50S ribosomal protein L23 [bacterium]
MAILNFIKEKKQKEEKLRKAKAEKKVPKKKTAQPKAAKTEEKVKEAKAPKKKGAVSGEEYRILRAPVVSEKAGDLVAKNQYVFKVFSSASKIEIKKAVENIYGVKVVGVNTINIHRKARKVRGKAGWKTGYKKAIVKVQKGQKIEILPR